MASAQELSDFLSSVEQRAFKQAVYAVRDDDARRARGRDGSVKARPVGVVGEDEAAVPAAAAARAAQLHPATGKGRAHITQAPQQRQRRHEQQRRAEVL